MHTWKSYAAVSGATVFAGWLASAPPSAVSEDRPAAPALSRLAAPGAPSDIAEQASRLQSRIRREMAYTSPERNPFQFEAVRPATPVVAGFAQPEPSVELSAPAAASRPFLTLAGVATDRVPQGVERTAILSSTLGVLLVRAGDEVLGEYRVGAVEDESVELISLADGSTLRLSFATPSAR
jgi:hypothetical protein